MQTLLSHHSEFLVFAASCVAAFGIQGLWLRKTKRAQLPWLVWILTGCLLAATWQLAEQAGTREQQRIERTTGDLARLYGEEMQKRGHWRLASDAAADDPLYVEMIETEKRWLALSPSVNDIYTFRKLPDGHIALIVDSETDYDRNGVYDGDREQRTKIGEVYEDGLVPSVEKALAGEAAFTKEAYTDRWGTWVSACVPLRAPDGRVEGVLGVDFDAANFMHNIVVAKWRVIGFMALMQMVLLGSGTVTSLLRAEAGERKRAYAELRGSEEQFRAMFETASIGMAQADPRTGQWVRVNQRLCVISGYSADELLRLHFSEITHPDDRQADWDAFQRVVRGEAPDYQMEKRYIRKDGTIAWVNVNMAIVRDAAGQPVRTMSTIEDIMERRQTEETLRTLSRAVEQSPASIVITDTCGNIEYANPKFTEVTGYTIDEARWKNPRILKSGETPPEEYARLWQSITQGQEWHGEFHNKKKNGDLYWESATISPILDATGCTTHFVAVKEDITERKNAEAELAGVERKLRAAFRQAGMAEVATSVLHNVGNVLNSVNVSLGIATEKAGQMKAASIVRIAALLREHADDLPAFFANHPQGARLPQFLEQLAGHFAADQQSVLGELYSLRTNIEHINEIVAMQQSYAGAGGVIEVLPLADVVEDALRMNLAAFDRHGTNVVREFDSALPPVAVDRNKVLLILVNVVRNAKYACDEAGRGDKRITVRTHLNGDGIARISVSDNGVGIPPGNLTRIFEHGFTTRKGGHGFGLHSSALAAAEMGGSLRAESDGTGTGATFTLELPVSPDHT